MRNIYIRLLLTSILIISSTGLFAQTKERNYKKYNSLFVNTIK